MSAQLRSTALWMLAALLLGTSLGVAARPINGRDPLTLSGSEYFKVRLAAARLLGRHDDRESTLRLHALLSDPHPLVRAMAQSTLDRRDLSARLCDTVAVHDAR